MFETIFISFITYYIELQFLTAVSGRKKCEVHARTPFVSLLLLSVFHSFFSSPFFLFMGFHCSCSRQDIAIPCCCHAAFSGVCRNAPVLPCMSCHHPLPWYGCKLSSVRNVRRSTGFHIRFLPVATRLPLSRFHPVRSILPAGCLCWNRSRSTSRCGNSAVERVAAAGERTPGNAVSVPFQPGSSCRVSFVITVTE